jgi:hypothetical protein
VTPRGRMAVRIVGASFALIVVLAAAVGYQVWKTNGCACGLAERTPSTVYSPFRDREPEHVALRYLTGMATGNCSSLPPSLFVTERIPADCGVRYRLADWQLRARQNNATGVELDYEVAWAGMKERDDPLGVQLVRRGSNWQIASIDTWY